jgi:hypothetical protein
MTWKRVVAPTKIRNAAETPHSATINSLVGMVLIQRPKRKYVATMLMRMNQRQL